MELWSRTEVEQVEAKEENIRDEGVHSLAPLSDNRVHRTCRNGTLKATIEEDDLESCGGVPAMRVRATDRKR